MTEGGRLGIYRLKVLHFFMSRLSRSPGSFLEWQNPPWSVPVKYLMIEGQRNIFSQKVHLRLLLAHRNFSMHWWTFFSFRRNRQKKMANLSSPLTFFAPPKQRAVQFLPRSLIKKSCTCPINNTCIYGYLIGRQLLHHAIATMCNTRKKKHSTLADHNFSWRLFSNCDWARHDNRVRPQGRARNTPTMVDTQAYHADARANLSQSDFLRRS